MMATDAQALEEPLRTLCSNEGIYSTLFLAIGASGRARHRHEK